MTNNYYQKHIETMPVEELQKLQSQKLVKQVQHVYDNVPYYRNLMDEKGVRPEDIRGIEDLHSCLSFPKPISGIATLTECWQYQNQTASEFTQPQAQQADVWSHSIHSMI